MVKNLLLSIICIVILTIGSLSSIVHADNDASAIQQSIEDAFNWKKSSLQIDEEHSLLSTPLLKDAGSTVADWYALAAARVGLAESYLSYQAVLKNSIVSRYQTEQKLSDQKATEWHRIALAFSATGGDATNVEGIDLIDDGVFNRGRVASLDTQGLNGYIWALITVNSMQYATPENAVDTRSTIIAGILNKQLMNGGFTLDDDEANVDITAMAIQALAPYIHSNETFKLANDEVKTVYQAVSDALTYLQNEQLQTGNFASWNEVNLESLAQVTIALSSLDFQQEQMQNFEREGRTLLDNLMAFTQKDGGFTHSFMFNESNESAIPNESNSMATEQAILALTAYYRQLNNERSLYDFRASWSTTTRQLLNEIATYTDQWTTNTPKEEVVKVLPLIEQVPYNERQYIGNHFIVQTLLQTYNLTAVNSSSVDKDFENEAPFKGTIEPLFSTSFKNETLISAEHLQLINKIIATPSTQYYTDVLELLALFERSTNAGQYDEQYEQLLGMKQRIEILQVEIETLNNLILDHLYPYNAITKSDERYITDLQNRYNALSKYDQQQIIGYDDVMRAASKITTEKRGIAIYISCTALLMIVILGWLFSKRKRKEG